MKRFLQNTLVALIAVAGLSRTVLAASPLEDAIAAMAKAGNTRSLANRLYQKAFDLALPLAEQGDRQAQYMVGAMLEYGSHTGGQPDRAGAIAWFTKASDRGDPKSRLELAHMGALQLDDAETDKLVRQAAEEGDATYEAALAIMYEQGRMGPKDDKEAFKWYLRAADQGDDISQAVVGQMYADGRGVPQNDVQAYLWLSLTAAAPIPDRKNAADLAQKMAPADLAKAKKLVAAWLPVKCRKTPKEPCPYLHPPALK